MCCSLWLSRQVSCLILRLNLIALQWRHSPHSRLTLYNNSLMKNFMIKDWCCVSEIKAWFPFWKTIKTSQTKKKRSSGALWVWKKIIWRYHKTRARCLHLTSSEMNLSFKIHLLWKLFQKTHPFSPSSHWFEPSLWNQCWVRTILSPLNSSRDSILKYLLIHQRSKRNANSKWKCLMLLKLMRLFHLMIISMALICFLILEMSRFVSQKSLSRCPSMTKINFKITKWDSQVRRLNSQMNINLPDKWTDQLSHLSSVWTLLRAMNMFAQNRLRESWNYVRKRETNIKRMLTASISRTNS